MIYSLRKKFIRICTLSFLAVFFVLLCAIFLFTQLQTNAAVDKLTDRIAENGGTFPAPDAEPPPRPNGAQAPDDAPILDRESSFTTRYFTVSYDADGSLIATNTDAIFGVTDEDAAAYAEKVLAKSNPRGWVGAYRYRIVTDETGTLVVFVSGAMQHASNRMFLWAAAIVFAAGCLIVLLLVVLLSKHAVKPAAESYEKQKQFITDANHELKTPLTLIMTNLDIAESELGKNDWLDDARKESQKMSVLVNRLVSLARMDEADNKPVLCRFSLSDAVEDTASAFQSAVEASGKTLTLQVESQVQYEGDEAMLRQLLSILLDNAAKYCDENGAITVTLQGGRHPLLTVDNSYAEIGDIRLDRLFDRFYRADKARTFGSGFGIGLSVAKAIVAKHHGELTAHNLGGAAIRFQVRL